MWKSNENFLNYSIFSQLKYEYFIAGISGGITSSLILHPLELLKIRLATQDGNISDIPKYNNLRDAVKTIYKDERIRGFYRGVFPSVVVSGCAWGSYFILYNAYKLSIQNEKNKVLSPIQHLTGASVSGLLTLLWTNPLWVVKTRICLTSANTNSTTATSSTYYANSLDAIRKIFRNEGIRGFYKGIIPGVFGVSHGAVQFMTYEELIKLYNKYKDRESNTSLKTMECLIISACSKIVAVSVTYPYQLIRLRLQNQFAEYSGSINCIVRTFRNEGIRGFYKGMSANLIRVTPATMITFVTYENIANYLLKNNR